jgi:hypothetical protein
MSEPTDQILSAIAHELTGLVAANCCAKTGGRGGPAASKHCECRETALDVYRAAAPLIEAAVLERAEGWRPIETAPKDGTSFLWCEELRGQCAVISWPTYRECFTTGRWHPLPPPPAAEPEEGTK